MTHDYYILCMYTTGCPKKHGNSVTNWISSLLWITIVIPNFKSHNITLVGNTILNQRIIWKDDIEFVTEFPCLLGHPVYNNTCLKIPSILIKKKNLTKPNIWNVWNIVLGSAHKSANMHCCYWRNCKLKINDLHKEQIS